MGIGREDGTRIRKGRGGKIAKDKGRRRRKMGKDGKDGKVIGGKVGVG